MQLPLDTPPGWVTTTSFLLASAKIFSAAVALIILGRGNLRAAAAANELAGHRKREPTRPIVGQL